jgi:hypothetical protein
MRLAIGFISFREAEVSQIDTIPKPVGLGSDGPRNGLSCPVVVRLLSGTRPVSVRYM